MFAKTLPIPMPEGAWKLLGMYLAIMNYRLLEQGSRQINLSKTFGAIVTQYLVQHEEWIRQEFYRVRTTVWAKGTIHRYFDDEQLEAIESAKASEIPDAVRIGWWDRHSRAA